MQWNPVTLHFFVTNQNAQVTKMIWIACIYQSPWAKWVCLHYQHRWSCHEIHIHIQFTILPNMIITQILFTKNKCFKSLHGWIFKYNFLNGLWMIYSYSNNVCIMHILQRIFLKTKDRHYTWGHWWKVYKRICCLCKLLVTMTCDPTFDLEVVVAWPGS